MNIKMIIPLLALIVSCTAMPIRIRSAIVTSEYTPATFLKDLTASNSQTAEIQIFQFSDEIISALHRLGLNAIFDFTACTLYQTTLRNFANTNEILYFTDGKAHKAIQKWTFYLHSPPETEAVAIDTLAKYLNWTEYHLITSESEESRTVFSHLSSLNYNLLSNDAVQEVFDKYVGRVIKPTGNWKIVFLGESLGVTKFFESLEKNRIYKERCGLILKSKASWSESKVGTVFVVEEGLEGASSEGDYAFKGILRAINILENCVSNLRGSIVHNDLILKYLEKNTRNHVISRNYSIVNNKGNLKIIGRIESGSSLDTNTIEETDIEIFDSFMFPGNVTAMNFSPPKVLVSANTGPIDWNGEFSDITFLISAGIQPMVSIVNEDPEILKNFELVVQDTDCGSIYFKYEYTSSCMEKYYDRLGAAHIGALGTQAQEGYIDLFRENGIHKPNIGQFHNIEKFYDKTLYPEMMITTPKLIYILSIVPYILKSFRWENIIAIFDDSSEPQFISAFLDNARILGLNIMNSEPNRYIPYFKTETYYQDVKGIIQEIYDSRCKIIVVMATSPCHLYFLEALYDFGFRRGDLVLFYQAPMSELIDYPQVYNFDREKVLEVSDGSLAVFFAEYVGEYGQQLKAQIEPMILPLPITYTCYRLDSLMLAVHTIDLMINIGRDYEDEQDLNYFMRWIKFTGCTGLISIDSSGNGLSDIKYTFYNFYLTEEGWEENIIGSYTIGISVPLKISRDIVWPYGTTEIPDDMKYEPVCGFPDSERQPNSDSRRVTVYITVGLLILVSVLAFFMWRKCSNIELEYLEEKEEMFFEDGVMLYMPIFEAAQIVGMGPQFQKVFPLISPAFSLAILDLDEVIDFEFNDYWIGMRIILGVTSFWCLSLLMTLTGCYKRFPTLFADTFEVVGLKMFQVFSQGCLVAINFVLLKMLECREGISDELEDSFLHNDCTTFCWKGTHLNYAIVTSCVLVIYNCFAILCRPVSEYMMDYVHVKTTPLYAFIKGIFQVVLVVLNFHLKTDHNKLYSGLFFSVLLLWTLLTLKVDPYNYHRLNFWQRFILVTVCTHELIMIAYSLFRIDEVVIYILEPILLALFLVYGIYTQVKRYPSMLYRRKGRNFEKLLKFNFTRRIRPEELTVHQLDYVNKIQEVNQ